MMFYLNVFFFPALKQVVEHYKMWSDMIFWFSQMIFFNVYIPLLIRQANVGEENPGPTIDLMSLIQQYMQTIVKEMKLSLVKMLVSNG